MYKTERIIFYSEKIDIQSKKIDELSNYIQEFKAQEIKADKPQEFRKTSKSVVYCDVAPKLKIPLLKKDTPKYNTCKLKNQKYTIETMTTVHPMCMDKVWENYDYNNIITSYIVFIIRGNGGNPLS